MKTNAAAAPQVSSANAARLAPFTSVTTPANDRGRDAQAVNAQLLTYSLLPAAPESTAASAPKGSASETTPSTPSTSKAPSTPSTSKAAPSSKSTPTTESSTSPPTIKPRKLFWNNLAGALEYSYQLKGR